MALITNGPMRRDRPAQSKIADGVRFNLCSGNCLKASGAGSGKVSWDPSWSIGKSREVVSELFFAGER